ncbi:MAG: sensor domain-containing diguanylate cyclase [Alphaproteobacteria bacterium]|nr:sensor domain-containing diguanylate cyclase [Alphaproteobacteria bacterium]
MQIAPHHPQENERLKALNDLHILDTPLEERFERITRLVKSVLGVPVAAFTLIDKDRQWLKSIQGADLTETHRDLAFCGHTILENDILSVRDATEDARFVDHPFVTDGLGIRFYAGCPVKAPNGMPIGSLCAVDTKPRDFTEEEKATLRDLASLVETELRAAQLFAVRGELITELDNAQRLALVDPLTRIWNRRGVNELLKRRWSETARNGDSTVLVVTDIDHFKRINDTYGHQVGDVVIQSVAKNLLTALREEDAVGRIGGEEFLLILTGCHVAEIRNTVERVRAAIADTPIEAEGHTLDITMSFGAAVGSPETLESFDALIQVADKALYLAKHNGRNRVEVDEKSLQALVDSGD